MTYTIGKTFGFAAGHHLPQLPEEHKCHRPHGHNYSVTVELSSGALDPTGFVLDYAGLDVFRGYLDQRLDHRNLNDVFTFPPTAEMLARHLYDVAEELIGGMVSAVRVEETPNTFAEYRP